jgi:hypothetical protein
LKAFRGAWRPTELIVEAGNTQPLFAPRGASFVAAALPLGLEAGAAFVIYPALYKAMRPKTVVRVCSRLSR